MISQYLYIPNEKLLVYLYLMWLDNLFRIEDRDTISLILLFVLSGKILVTLKSFYAKILALIIISEFHKMRNHEKFIYTHLIFSASATKLNLEG